MALTERESADKHTSTSRRMQREADIQPPSGGRRTQPIMSESVGKASLVLAIAPCLPVLSYNETSWLAAAITIFFVYVRLLMERQKSNRRTLKNPSRHGIIKHKQTVIKSLKFQCIKEIVQTSFRVQSK